MRTSKHRQSRCALARSTAALALALVGVVVLAGCGRSGDGRPGKSGQTVPFLLTNSFVQQNSATPQTPTSTVRVPFAAAQTAGNLDVVVVGWNDTTAKVSSVSDTKGNVYQLAVGPTVRTTALTQSIYYAKNIAAAAAGANAVTVSFTLPAVWPDVRVLEYAGLDRVTPVDVTSAAAGGTSTSSTPAVATTNASDLLFAANVTTSTTRAAGSGWTNRVITSPDGDIAEDRVVGAIGSYTSTAPLTSAGDWVMQMVAFRAAPSGPDTQPPTAPANLTATAVSTGQINLAWTASSDNVGVTGYLIESCAGAGCTNFAQIATATGTSYSNTGLTASTSYSYRVRATDAAGNLSGYSNTASATTPTPDTQPPTAPSNLTATATSTSEIDLAWTASTDNVGVTGYLVESCAGAGCTNYVQIATVTTTSYSNTGLIASTTYGYRVRATDAANNPSGYSNTASATTLSPDTQPPTAPSNLTATAASSGKINLSWTASMDDVGVTGYFVERCVGAGCSSFAQIASSASTAYADGSVSPSTAYGYRVRATDAAGNLSGYSNLATATTPGAPVTPTYVQGNYATPQTSVASVTVPYTAAQSSGGLNVVVVGWNDTTTRVSSVVDTKANPYALAVGPTVGNGLSQSIYFASNIANANAGENKVTVTFNAPAQFADVRILQYKGIAAASPVDVVAASTGTTSTSTSGPALTTNGVDLLLGANVVQALTNGPGAGFTSRLLTSPDGDIAEDRVVTATGSYSATAPLSSAGSGWIMQMVAFKASGVAPPPDTTPPTVTVTSPAAGATLSGTVTVNVTASDAQSGIDATQVLVDGVPATPPDTSAPYSFSLDTTKFSNGSHSLGATAVDSARNTGTAPPVQVTFTNTNAGNPAALGLWSGAIALPIVPVHVAQLPAGKVLMWDGQSNGFDGRVWDPATNTLTSAPIPVNDFCGAHEQMADGRIFVAGGHNGGAHLGLPTANLFDLSAQSWTVLPDMNYPRWYPTATTLPDGRLFVLGGESTCSGCEVLVPEIYAPATNSWAHLTDAPFSFPYYPHVYVLPDGRVLVPGTSEEPIVSEIFDLSLHTWTAVGGPAVDGGSSAMYRPGKILKTGTSIDPDGVSRSSVATAYVLDTTRPAPIWRAVASMAFPRTYHTLTLLPDGNVLVTGGGPTTAATDTAHAILPAEVWSPASETWTQLGPMSAPRLYHSSAMLLPDARVAVLGGGRFDDVTAPTDQFSAEIFAPPYLFKGPRPVISSAPATVQLGQTFSIQTPDAARVTSVSLLRFGSVTHTINMAQRFLPLAFTAASGSLTVTAPANANLATPGNYMLFLVDALGVPSTAAIVRI